ncbi:g13259 [Coccomyxa viridis]|uniref:G13259 protein n=1 Tax=Coccomyxa viridis TaxID=1274662 RepID=A0ABP1GCB5_9CHLO
MSYTGSPPPRQGDYSNAVDPGDALYNSDTFADPGGLRSPLKSSPGQNPSSFRDEERRWRAEDLEQRALDNARVLWARFVEKNRRDVEERAEQLKGFSNLAALVAGFVMISYLQFGFDSSTQNPSVLIGFGLTTAVVVALSFSSMTMCGLIHASILKMGRSYVTEEEEAEFIHHCRDFALRYKSGDRPPQPQRTFQNTWRARCEDDWLAAFYMFSASIPWLFANLALASFIKFKDSQVTAIAVTVVLGIGCLYFFLSHGRWLRYVSGFSQSDMQSHLKEGDEPMGLPFDWHLRPRRITKLRSSAAQQAEQAGASLGMGRLSSLRQSVAGIRNTLRRFSMHPDAREDSQDDSEFHGKQDQPWHSAGGGIAGSPAIKADAAANAHPV